MCHLTTIYIHIKLLLAIVMVAISNRVYSLTHPLAVACNLTCSLDDYNVCANASATGNWFNNGSIEKFNRLAEGNAEEGVKRREIRRIRATEIDKEREERKETRKKIKLNLLNSIERIFAVCMSLRFYPFFR